MKRTLALLTLGLLAVWGLLSACSTPAPEYRSAPELGSYLQPDFATYSRETRNWLAEHRHFLTDDHARELADNAPFELMPRAATPGLRKGVLLVHGLGDSPYSFVDIARSLADAGFQVRTLLLPGHGSKPGDLMLPRTEDWQALVRHHRRLFAAEVDELWLGGFSTGANLVTLEALEQPDGVTGLLLFSPAFKPRHQLVQFAPWLNYLVDWADKETETNPVRYDSLAMNGAARYYQTSERVRAALARTSFAGPVFVALSEADSVVDTEAVLALFDSRFPHPASRLIWYGERPLSISRGQRLSMRLPDYRISTASHMSLLYAPHNPLYGIDGSQRICENGPSRTAKKRCLAGESVWFSGWGYTEADKLHARLTWNPYYTTANRLMLQVMGQTPPEPLAAATDKVPTELSATGAHWPAATPAVSSSGAPAE